MDSDGKVRVEEQDGKAAEKKGDFNEEMLATLGECSAPSMGKRNYWRGWRMKEQEDDEGLEPMLAPPLSPT